MSLWRWVGGALAILVAVAVGAAAYLATNAERAVETNNAFTKIRDLPSPLVGKAAPAVGLKSVTDGSLDLTTYRGKLLLVSFWSDF